MSDEGIFTLRVNQIYQTWQMVGTKESVLPLMTAIYIIFQVNDNFKWKLGTN